MDEREYLQEQQYLAGERSAEIEEAQSDPVYYADEATVIHLRSMSIPDGNAAY